MKLTSDYCILKIWQLVTLNNRVFNPIYSFLAENTFWIYFKNIEKSRAKKFKNYTRYVTNAGYLGRFKLYDQIIIQNPENIPTPPHKKTKNKKTPKYPPPLPKKINSLKGTGVPNPFRGPLCILALKLPFSILSNIWISDIVWKYKNM